MIQVNQIVKYKGEEYKVTSVSDTGVLVLQALKLPEEGSGKPSAVICTEQNLDKD